MRPELVPRPPQILPVAFDDPSLVTSLVRRHGPYWNQARYASEPGVAGALRRRLGGDEVEVAPDGDAPSGGPVFRGDWAYDTPLVAGVEPILENPRFLDAASRVFDGALVRPQIIYVNLNLPQPCLDVGHTDVPAFRGIERTRYPVWFLVLLGRSGLFERWRVHIATAVAWFYEGDGGGFSYWPHGPDAPPVTHEPPFSNTAVVGDNDFMFHRVEAVGTDPTLPDGLTKDSLLTATDEGGWSVLEGDRVLATYGFDEVRVSVSWKAQVFRDLEEERVCREHRDDLQLETAVDLLVDDIRARGGRVHRPRDPIRDLDFIAALARSYLRFPATSSRLAPVER